MELLSDAFRAFFSAGMPKGKKDPLFEGHLSDKGAQVFIPGAHLLTLDSCKPFYESMSLLSPVVPSKDGIEGFMLVLPELDKISPSA